MESEARRIRFPAELLIKAKKLKESNESLDDVVIKALEGEVQRRRSWAAHQRIINRSETIKIRNGIQPPSEDLIRTLTRGNLEFEVD